MSDAALAGGCLCFELGVAPEDAGYCRCTRGPGRKGSEASAQAFIDEARG